MTELVINDLYHRYRDKVLGYISSRISSYQDAEDLCEEVFLKLYKAVKNFDGKQAKVSTLLFKLTHDIVIDYYRTHKEHAELEDETASVEGADELVFDSEQLSSLKEALEKLSEQQREVIILHYYERMTLLKISEVMGLSYKMVKYRHSTALDELKKHLSGWAP